MAAPQVNPSSAWFDAAKHASLLAEMAKRTESFLATMADGRVDRWNLQRRRSVSWHSWRKSNRN